MTENVPFFPLSIEITVLKMEMFNQSRKTMLTGNTGSKLIERFLGSVIYHV